MDIATIFWAGHALAIAVGGAAGFIGLRQAAARNEQALIDGLLEMQENEFQTISADDPDVRLDSGRFHLATSLEELPFQLMGQSK